MQKLLKMFEILPNYFMLQYSRSMINFFLTFSRTSSNFLAFPLTFFTRKSIAVFCNLCFNLRFPANSSIPRSIYFLHLVQFKESSCLKLGPLVKIFPTFWVLISQIKSPVTTWRWSRSWNFEFWELQGYISLFSGYPSSSSIDSTVCL